MVGVADDQYKQAAEPAAAQANRLNQAIQAKAFTTGPAASDRVSGGMGGKRHTTSAKQRRNHTGLPDNLKSGIENLSGMPMDDVAVH